MLRPIDVAWLAGLLEGEGSFTIKRGDTPNVELTSVDEDVIDRVASLLPFGVRFNRLLPSGKTAYIWRVASQDHAAGLMMTLLPLMGERRRARIIECLDVWKAKPLSRKRQTHCKRGHPLSGDNLVIAYEGKYRKRRCRQCSAEREARYRERKERHCNAAQPERPARAAAASG